VTAVAGRIEPHDGLPPSLVARDAEEAVLGAALIDADALALLLVEVPDAGHFSDPRHGAMYRVLANLAGAGVPVTPETIRDTAARLRLTSLDLDELVCELVDAVPTSANLPHYAAIVRDRAQRRAVHQALVSAANRAVDLAVPLEDTAAVAASVLSGPSAVSQPPTLKALVQEVLTGIEQESKGGITPGIGSGLSRLDDLTRGFQRGTMTLLAARPSVGKTQFACAVARYACESEEPVLLISAEMSARQLVRRLMAMVSGVDLLALNRSPHAFDASATHLLSAGGVVHGWPLVVDTTSHSPGMVRLAAQRMMREHGKIGLVIVDYVQLLRGDGRAENRNLEVGSVGRGLFRVAQDLDVPVLALSQLSRDVEKSAGDRRGGGREPRLSDLRDSGELEQAADMVLFLHPTDEDETAVHRRIRAILAKNRHGRRGRVDLELASNTGRWKEAEGSSWAERV
jgi:replicative DNA helicase